MDVKLLQYSIVFLLINSSRPPLQLAECIYYNAGLALHTMEAAGKTATFFNMWFENLSHFKRAHDLHVTIGALCEILALPEQQLPPAVVAGLPFTVPAILNAVAQLPQAYKRKQDIKDYIEAEENGEIDDMDPYEEEPGALELGDDDDYADEEGDEYLNVCGHTCT